VDPGDFEDGLLGIQVFQPWELFAVDHANQPISHPLRPIMVKLVRAAPAVPRRRCIFASHIQTIWYYKSSKITRTSRSK
jgi:hypothetical protein